MPTNAMMKKLAEQSKRIRIVPDSDKLGLLLGTFSAAVVLAGSFFNELPLIQVALRMAMTFLAIYGVTFVATRIFVAIAKPELRPRRSEVTESPREEVEENE